MKKEVMEARKLCDYLINEIEVAMRKIKGAMGRGILDVLPSGNLAFIMKKSKIEEVEHHVSHIKFCLNKLQQEFYDINELSKLNRDGILDYNVMIWLDNIYTETFVKEEMEQMYRELEELRENVCLQYDKLNYTNSP